PTQPTPVTGACASICALPFHPPPHTTHRTFMAKSKYFHVKHNTTGAEKLVKAARQSLAIQAVTGGKGSLRPAADEEIHQHLITGGTLHEKSCPEGEGKLFFLHADTPVLIRAKNATTAFQLLNDGSY